LDLSAVLVDLVNVVGYLVSVWTPLRVQTTTETMMAIPTLFQNLAAVIFVATPYAIQPPSLSLLGAHLVKPSY
jgi:hypothetical protein